MRPIHWHVIALRYILSTPFVATLAACIFGGQAITSTPTPTLQSSLVDQSLLTDKPCRAPCWYGLVLDQSTKADVLDTAQKLSFIDPVAFPEEPFGYWDQSKQGEVPGMFIRLLCRQPKQQTCAGLVVVNDILKEIYLSPPPSLSFTDVVTHLGAPEYVQVIPVSGNGLLCNVALIWKQRGIRMAYLNAGPPKVRCADVRGGHNINPNLPVEQLTYSSSDDLALTSVPESGRDFPWLSFAKP